MYIYGVLARVCIANSEIPVMFEGGFKGESYSSKYFPTTANLVFDAQNY
jgi:hypothetical protein